MDHQCKKRFFSCPRIFRLPSKMSYFFRRAGTKQTTMAAIYKQGQGWLITHRSKFHHIHHLRGIRNRARFANRFLYVHAYMLVEVILAREGFAARATRVGPLSRVDAAMTCQLLVAHEGFVATWLRAGERAFSCTQKTTLTGEERPLFLHR